MGSDAPPSVEERLRQLVERELGADEVVVQPKSDAPEPADACWVTVALPDDRQLAARFREPPDDRMSIERRMQILVSAFSHLLSRQLGERARRVPIAQSLKGELSALAARARALEALVIDAHSPVVWGSASGLHQTEGERASEQVEAIRLVDLSRHELLALAKDDLATDPQHWTPTPPSPRAAEALAESQTDTALLELVARAIGAVRALPEFSGLKRGQPLVARHHEPGFGYVVHSFAGIYSLILIFDGVFDELRAERSVHESIERIERLVLALPPLDPTPDPTANVLRMPRRLR